MSAGAVRRVNRHAGLCVASACALCVAVLWAPTTAAAAPKTLHGAAYDVLLRRLDMYSKSGFSKVVKLGSKSAYKRKLAQLRIRVDPNLPKSEIDGRPPVALYDADTNTLYFSQDPRKAKAAERDALGQTVWHEVTHALEFKNKDDFTNPDPLYQDRNTYYMGDVAERALPRLESLERSAKSGASVATLKQIWRKYIEAMDGASQIPETRKYPPDLAKMRAWFGFRANPEEIRQLYLSQKALAGKDGANLRKALREVLTPQDWAGTWNHRATYVPLRLTITVSGHTATGVWTGGNGGYSDFRGTIGSDAETMTGTWVDSSEGTPVTISFNFRMHRDDITDELYFDGTRSDWSDGPFGMSSW